MNNIIKNQDINTQLKNKDVSPIYHTSERNNIVYPEVNKIKIEWGLNYFMVPIKTVDTQVNLT